MFGGRVTAGTFANSKEYFTWISIGIPFYVFGQAMNPVIRSDGSPKFAMFSTLAGAVVNVILDPAFIFIFHWGMMGAALATILGQLLTAALSAWYLFHMKSVKLSRESFRLHSSLMRRYIPLGACSFLAQISLVAAMAAINNMVQKYGAQDAIFGQSEYAQIPMAVIGIVMKFFQIVISVVIGMAAGCIPITGYNIGAGRSDRAKALFTRLLIAEFTVGAVALVIVQVFPRQLIAIFGAANESSYYTDFAVKAFRTYLCMMIFACVNKACFIFLQSMGRPWIHIHLHDTRGSVRRRLRAAFAGVVRAGRRAVFHARIGRTHLHHITCSHNKNPQRAPRFFSCKCMKKRSRPALSRRECLCQSYSFEYTDDIHASPLP